MAFTVGLTGGIGSGKTTVAELFASNGAGVVDTDEISHRLTSPGQPAVAEIARKFGPQFFATDGSLDRPRMRSLVFSDPAARKNLEAILHPLILAETARQIQNAIAPYVIVVVPLLIESGSYRKTVDRILVVDCEPETQIRRVIERSGLVRNEVLSIIATQVSRERRLTEANDIILNEGPLDSLMLQVKAFHMQYLRLAKSKIGSDPD
ncbi:MAG TPA: dephospho-CoA kinase [Burkholderiales bacterium]|nr:dephospho-CoA kinase [Burkholderiales bacterium]